MTQQLLSLFFGTFILEDVALVAGISLVAQGKLTWLASFSALFLGIVIGDLALYLFGLSAAHFPPVARLNFFTKIQRKFQHIERHSLVSSAVFFSRFVPGSRLVTYTLSGFVKYSFSKFFLLTLVSVFIWVFAAFEIGRVAHNFFAENLSFLIIFIISGLAIFRYFLKNLRNSWQRKIWINSFRKWGSFEFWPPWFFYLPLVPFYIYQSFKYRSFLLPFYADPFLEHGGLIGESKWQIYRHLEKGDFHLATEFVSRQEDPRSKIQELLRANRFSYPFILKPDVGQRGFAVRIIKTKEELSDYLKLASFDLIVQEYCDWSFEAGVFYIRMPHEKRGRIFSITDKEFPFVVGDGKSRIGDLILSDIRARIIAATYFARFGDGVERIPGVGEKVILSTCGNHCQGAIFKNGENLKSEQLLNAVERQALQIPDFYFGRFDVRYKNKASFENGRNIKIVEVNAGGSEATHIWDPNTTLIEAYRVLFRQWSFLFFIGHEVKRLNKIRYPVNLLKLGKELLALNKQEKKLTVSS